MKNILLITVFIVTIGLQSCSPKLQPSSAEVNFLYKEATGTIAVKSVGYGKKREDAIADAQKKAFNVILFRGLPGTELSMPLVENETEARSKHAEYFKRFFEQDNYKSFMMSSVESSNLIKIKGGNKISEDVKINYNSLRKDLEQNQVIRKFGF